MKINPFITLLFAKLLLTPCFAYADFFDWSNTEVQYLHGSNYRMPKNANAIDKSIITVSHADGWALGRDFFFMDTLISEQGEPSQVNVYGERTLQLF